MSFLAVGTEVHPLAVHYQRGAILPVMARGLALQTVTGSLDGVQLYTESSDSVDMSVIVALGLEVVNSSWPAALGCAGGAGLA
jgi:hypothetical protein